MIDGVPSIVDLNEQVISTLGAVGGLLGEGVASSASLAPELAPVRVEASAIQEVILHLVTNALKSAPSVDNLLLKTDNVRIECDKACGELGLPLGEYVRLTISDIGTAPNSATGLPPNCSNGLFLAPVYAFAKRNGGTATIRYGPSRGIVLCLYLPRAQPRP